MEVDGTDEQAAIEALSALVLWTLVINPFR